MKYSDPVFLKILRTYTFEQSKKKLHLQNFFGRPKH